MLKQLFLYLFIISSIFQISGEILQNEILIFTFKPLLMPFLLLWYLYRSRKHEIRTSMIITLIFSFFGDTFLLFVFKNEIFFLLGLGSFLIAQLSYVYTFYKDKQDKQLSLSFIILTTSFFLLYIGVLFFKIYPNLNEFLIPVIVYASAVGLMGITAAFRYQSVNKTSFNQVFIGAFLFIISDTFIALDKFLYNGGLAFASLIIMSLYILGQYFIVKGILMKKK